MQTQFGLCLMYNITKLTLLSLFYNDFANKYYIGDTFLEPLIWFVDHFSKILGPVCVTAVIVLATSFISVVYIIGLPFYFRQSVYVLTLALILGHWILINVVSYYYLAFTTEPGFPPQGAMIAEAASICKQCIAPKPPRTHHCRVCNRCILKMDHHCPWLNNCVGHFNHRYFFMFCAYTWIGIVFVILFGIPVAYDHFFGKSENSSISPIIVNFVRSIPNHMFFKPHLFQEVSIQHHHSNFTEIGNNWPESLYHSCIVYAALLCVAVFLILSGLLTWHARLISRGETSVEGHLNKQESARLLKEGIVYKNPYDYGLETNWNVFLCLNHCRFWWNLLLPFVAKPIGDGMQWNMSNIEYSMGPRQTHPKECFVKIS